MQEPEALTRVARECVEDLAEDGVVYAEVRYAPEQHVTGGLDLDEVVSAVQRGFDEGMAARRRPDRRPPAAHRDAPPGPLAARSPSSSIAWRDRGVAGFDIAGAEAGYPPTRHLDAFEYLQRENSHFTIHAGEAFGLPSIWQAIQWCGADRLGHGVRIIDDITVDGDGAVDLGRLAAYVRDMRIPLEMCPHSNVQTGAAASIAEHPIGLLTRLRFRVTVNTDNRLMSQTSMSKEMTALVDAFGYTLEDLRWFTINAMKSAFLPFDERLAIIDDVDQARVRRARGAVDLSTPATPARSSVLYERPQRRAGDRRTSADRGGDGRVDALRALGRDAVGQPREEDAALLGRALENFLPISLTAGSSFLDW